MKKQILILTFFIAAILAGTNAFGQSVYIEYPETPSFISATQLACADTTDEIHPAPGEPYTYIVNTTSAYDDVRWFVVDNSALTTAGDSLINNQGIVLDRTNTNIDVADGTGDYVLRLGDLVGAGNVSYNVDPVADLIGMSSNGTGTQHAIDLTWKSFDGITNQVLLVALVADSTGCTNNIVVYRIIPEFLFTLDIAALGDAGDSVSAPLTTIAEECVSPIEYAWYSGSSDTPDQLLTVDYGEDWVFFAVNANNFVDSWMPRFQISYSGATAGIPMIAEWAYASDNFAAGGAATQTWYPIDIAAGTTAKPVVAGGLDGSFAENNAVGGGIAAAAGGENIIVRVQLDYGTGFEIDDTDIVISFAVDGVMYDANGDPADTADDFLFANIPLKDLGEATVALGPCIDDNWDNDVMDYLITPRPEVENAIPSTTGVDTEDKTGDEN